MSQLKVFRGEQLVRTVELTDRSLRIGRAPENDVVLEDSGTAVSRFHAEVRPSSAGYVVVNLSQPFGMRAGGSRSERLLLDPERPVEIGPYELRLAPAPVSAAVAAGATREFPVAVARSRDVARDTAPAMAIPPLVIRSEPLALASAGRLESDVTGYQAPAAFEPAPATAPFGAFEPSPVAVDARMAKARRESRLAGLLALGAVAAGVVAIVAVGSIVTPRSVTEPQPVAASPSPVSAVAPTESGLAIHLAHAREAVDAGQYREALEDYLSHVLSVQPDHAEALALKARAEAGLQRVNAPAGAPRAVHAATSTSATDRDRAAGGSTNATAAAASPAAAKILRKSGPSTPDPLAGRNPDVIRRYRQAIDALNAGQYRFAISNLQSVLRSDASFPDAEGKLNEAKAIVRGQAEAAFAEGGRLEKGGDYQGAIKAYERSKDFAIQMYGEMTGADEAIARARGAMSSAGVDAFKRARQFDALGRSADAVAMYAKAVELLPSDDPNRQIAQERLGALRK